MKEFNNYPALEKAYGETCFEEHRRELDLIDNITEHNNKAIKLLSRILKPRKKKNGDTLSEVKEKSNGIR